MTASARLDLRIPQDAKLRIERAAELTGRSVTAFVTEVVLARADELLDGAPTAAPVERPLGGWSFTIPDDFDEPLDDFAAYR